jgi:alkylhydroperoxidase family enzyme
MRSFAKLRAYARVMRQAKRPLDLLRLLRRRPALLLAVNAYEMALMASNRVDARLKALAQIKTSALIGCPF